MNAGVPMGLEMEELREDYSICRLSPSSSPPDWSAESEFLSMTRTEDELSIVCPTRRVPEGCREERSWRCLKVKGPLALGLVGVLASLAKPLAEAEIPIFAVSTFDTDYLLVTRNDLGKAVEVLRRSGVTVRENP